MKYLYSLVLLLPCLLPQAMGQTQKIVGTEPVGLGEIIELSLSPVADAPEDFVKHAVDWKVFDGDKQRRVIHAADGKVLVAAGINPARLKVFASVSYLYQKEKLKSKLLTETVVVGSPPGPTPPGPNPNPNPPGPAPVFPDGKYKVAAKVYDLFVKHVPLDAHKLAPALQKNYEGMAAAVNAGVIKTGTDLLKQTTEKNRSSLVAEGVSKESVDLFFNALELLVWELYDGKKVGSMADWATVWNEIALGLSKVK